MPNLQRDHDVAESMTERGAQHEGNSALWACLGRLSKQKDGEQAQSNLLAANAGFLFGAGYDTTAHAITWALFELAADPSIQVSSAHNTSLCVM